MKAQEKIVLAAFLSSLILISLILVFEFQPAQANLANVQWVHTYSTPANETAFAVTQTTDEGYAIAGGNSTAVGFSNTDALLLKTDASGKELWDETYETATFELTANSVIQTADKGYALVFTTQNSSTSAALLIKTNSLGKPLWNDSTRAYNTACSVVQTIEGDLVWAGTASYPYPSESYIWLNKTDSFGNSIWGKTYGDKTVAFSMIQTNDGGYALTGLQQGIGALLIRTDSEGNEVWNKTYNGLTEFSNGALLETSDGGFAIAGYAIVADTPQYYLYKADASGNLQWNRTYGFSISSLAQTGDGGYLLSGQSELVKTDFSGELQWREQFNGANLVRVIGTNDGNYAIVGTLSGKGFSYSWLSKISLNSTPAPTPPPTSMAIAGVQLAVVVVVVVVIIFLFVGAVLVFRKREQIKNESNNGTLL